MHECDTPMLETSRKANSQPPPTTNCAVFNVVIVCMNASSKNNHTRKKDQCDLSERASGTFEALRLKSTLKEGKTERRDVRKQAVVMKEATDLACL